MSKSCKSIPLFSSNAGQMLNRIEIGCFCFMSKTRKEPEIQVTSEYKPWHINISILGENHASYGAAKQTYVKG